MAVHGNGTFDHDLKKWKLRTKELKATATIPQLRKMFGADIPASERESKPYWLRYLKELRKLKAVQDADRELEEAKARYKDYDPDPTWSKFERGPGGEIRRKKPLTAEQLDILILTEGIRDPNNPVEFRDYLLEQLQAKVKPEIPDAESLKAEIDRYVAAEKAKCEKLRTKGRQGKHYHMVKQYLALFFEVTGNIRVRDITRQHYQEFVAGLDGSSTKYLWNEGEKRWGKTTQANIQQQLHMFLKHLEIEYEVSFPYIRNPRTRIKRTDGKKTNWTLEQVRTALKHATGDARLMLLCGLNFGWYIDDVRELEEDKHYDGTHVHKGRSKNEGKSDFVGSWLVWPETAAVLAYGRPKTALYEAFKALRKEHDLPEHSDLRKTVQQWIEDAIELAGGEQVARLYRCEKAKGNHGRYYSKFTPEQREALDKALRFVRAKLFG